MILEPVEKIDQIKKADLLVFKNRDGNAEAYTVVEVKVSHDGTEIILRKKGNIYFNLGMYLAGTSWVKDLRIVRP